MIIIKSDRFCTAFTSYIVNQISAVICFYGQKLSVLSIVRKDEWSFIIGSSNQTTNLVSTDVALFKRKTDLLLVQKGFSQLKKIENRKIRNIGQENW